ncbi:hypothetical protein [Streptomyces sp. CFMR 7]|uniref:hypothetical protein n=1 Tax=Streptomyces sp. CFMR 7 TaxID=1649184 RepID=UPI0011A765E6|nr:hypothetical protein [Streptomyces sp. CFMR 7]
MYRSADPAAPVTPGPPPDAAPHGRAPGPLAATHVPFIAVTAGEGGLDIPRLLTGADGWIRYAEPGPFDRYPELDDVLLARTLSTVPSGRPDGHVLSPYRHAHCMLNHLCQGCGSPAERGEDGLLFVLPATRSDGSPAAACGLNDMPPSCARCALRHCPLLSSRGRKLLWAGQAEVIGVYGEVFLPPAEPERPFPASLTLPGSLRHLSDRLVSFDDEQTLSATVATRLVCNLQRVTDADPQHIAELARRRARADGCAGTGAATGPGRRA